jgi:hypothetical protein
LISTLTRRLRTAAALLFTAAAIALPGLTGAGSATAATATLPCDIYASGGTPCQAAYSSTRALFGSYDGPLYQVQRASDGSYLNVGLDSAGGIVDISPETSFCSGTSCTITELYDQTSNGNNMPVSAGTSCSGCSGGIGGPGPGGADIGAPALALPVTVGGRSAYGMLFNAQGTGYRIDDAKNVATGSEPEGIYMLTSSNVTSGSCCFDFGSAETNNSDDGNATMNAIYYGTDCWTGNCSGSGPWVGGDIENGMYFSNTGANPSSIPSESGTFLSAWEKNNGSTDFTLKYGNGQAGGLTTSYSGALPNGYDPMKVQNSIELGTGGDNSPWGKGEFFEGAVVSGFPSDATETAVQASIVAAGYGGNSSSSVTGPLHAVGAGQCLDDPNASTTGGTQQQIWGCNGQANQTWTHTSSNELTLTVGGTTECLDASGQGTSPGTKAIIWPCSGQANQQWTLNSNGTVTGVQSGLCLDVTGASTAEGALVELWTCNGGSNQQWSLG